jgi:hypothetical protein
MGAFIDLTGRVFGRWTVLHRVSNKGCRPAWKCVCTCGTSRTVISADMVNGKSTSCGCLRKESTSTQSGLATSDAYQCWHSMVTRCVNTDHVAYSRYGGAGISVCREWLYDFPAFLSHIGARPSLAHSIDRVDNSKGYEPGNVRWATRNEQAANRKTTSVVEYQGVSNPLPMLARAHGLSPKLVYRRVFVSGWSVEKALGLST